MGPHFPFPRKPELRQLNIQGPSRAETRWLAGTKHTLAESGPTLAEGTSEHQEDWERPWASADVAPNIIHSTNDHPVSTRARPQIRSKAETHHGSDVPMTGAGTGGHRDQRKGHGEEDLGREAELPGVSTRKKLSVLLLSDGCGTRWLLPTL